MKRFLTFIVLTLLMVMQGCAKGEDSIQIQGIDSTEKNISERGEEMIEEVLEESIKGASDQELDQELSEEPKPLQPLTENNTGKVLIQTISTSYTYPYNSYIISSVNGENVVLDPTEMPLVEVVDINPAAIAITHSHPDHTDMRFQLAYDCPKLIYNKGEIQTKDFYIYTIISSHNNDIISESNKNVIIVVEVDGLRIAHMGDIGQTFLIEEQLLELGDIDIAFMQFENSYSDMSISNEKGFNLIEQLNPKIIIPTHYTDKALAVMEERYGEITILDNNMQVLKEDLPEDTLNVVRILNKYKY